MKKKPVNRISTFLLIALAIATVSSCKDIIAEDITGNMPVLILPQSNDTVQSNPVHFKWEAIAGATRYRLQIVRPNFGNITDFVIDSMITATDFYMALDSNEYELKLTAMNAGYSSATLGPVHFWVGISPSSGGGSAVVLQTPAEQAYLGETFLEDRAFDWNDISNAHFEFSIRKGSSWENFTEIVHTSPSLSSSNYILPGSVNLPQGKYLWGVKSYVNSVESPSTVRTFYIDTIRPAQATLSNPFDNSFENAGPIMFSWTVTAAGNNQAPVSSVLEIATDNAFTNLLNLSGTGEVDANTSTVSLVSGLYYWRVRNIDAAGNEAGYSTPRQLTVTL
jgi:hypothetical protein